MPSSARTLVVAVLAGALTGSVLLGGVAPATAGPVDCSHPSSLHGTRLSDCVAQLRTRSEAAGRRAVVADEAWLQAKLATRTARQRLAAAGSAADRAEATAQRSRTRAGMVAATLARGGGSVGQTASVLLSSRSAGSVLYHLSRMTELGTDTGRIARSAVRDSRTADAARAIETLAAEQVAGSQRDAAAAYRTAKRRSDQAIRLVQQAELQQDPRGSTMKASTVDLPADAPKADRVVAYARAEIGKPYVFGGAGPATWDCSGLTMEALGSIGRSIGGHSSNAQYHLAAREGLLVPYSAAQPGDLVFYGSGDYYHVAVYSGGGSMIEAPQPGEDVREVPVRTDGLAPMVARFTG